jgi:hypothetical protein
MCFEKTKHYIDESGFVKLRRLFNSNEFDRVFLSQYDYYQQIIDHITEEGNL